MILCQVQDQLGELEGKESIRSAIDIIYNKILDWKKNIFPTPIGKCGNDLIKELTILSQLFVRDIEWKRLGLALVHIVRESTEKAQEI